MGFIYNKPLSLEQIFSVFNNKGGDKIDKEEAANAKNVSIFNGFIVEENMTLEDFEEKNLETYKKYEELNTKAWANQQREVYIKYLRANFGIKEGSADDIKSGESIEDFEARLLYKAAQEDYQNAMEEKEEEIAKKETLINIAKDNGITFSEEEIKSLSLKDLSNLFNVKIIKRDAKKMIDDDIRNMSRNWGQ